MRRLDDDLIDPDIAAQLDAIDATLAGEPVAPEHAEIAELALLLAASRPQIDDAAARFLDQRVERRFAGEPSASGARGVRGRLAWRAGVGTLAAGLAALAVVVVNAGGGGGGASSSSTASAAPSVAGGGHVAAARGAAAGGGAAGPQTASAPAGGGAAGPQTASAPAGAAVAPTPPTNGRKIVQSAQLALTTAPNRVENVAQQVFDVIGRESGIVRSSSVTATGGPDGYAQFQLSIPSSALGETMTGLSRLQFAQVASRTDTSQDVNDQYISLTHRLADDRALRAALLRQLGRASTPGQIDSLNARIRDAESAIASDQSNLRSLNRAVNYSQISLTINAGTGPVANGSGSSFTIGKAAHDAGRVLTVAAGIALIALAGLVPAVLIGALVWWVLATTRRRRREHTLDLA